MIIRSVMLVDDEPDLRSMAQLCLETGGGWEVVAAGSGREALELAARKPSDVLLLDVNMPGLDGPALVQALRRLPGWESTPVIFLTASTGKPELDRLLSLGAIGVIPKPFDALSLASDVQRLVDSAGPAQTP